GHRGTVAGSFGSEFLAADGMRGKSGANHAPHVSLDIAIRHGHGGVVDLALHGKWRAEVLENDAARHIGQLLAERESSGKVRMLGEAHRRSLLRVHPITALPRSTHR